MTNPFETPQNIGPETGENKVVKKTPEKRKKFESIPVTEEEVIEVLNGGEFYDKNVSKIWDRYCSQCSREARDQAESPELADALYDEKRLATLRKTKFADPSIVDFKGYISVIKASINKKSVIERFEEAQKDIDPDDNESKYLDEPKKPKESLLESAPQVAKIEGLINEFETSHDIAALSIVDVLTVDSAAKRDVAKLDLASIHEALNDLINNTNVATEKYHELNAKFDILSKAVGIINRGRVEHR